MAPSIFSRSSTAASSGPVESVRPVAPVPAPTDLFVAQWSKELSAIAAADSDPALAPRMPLGPAHPGGLAQLYAEHTTRLSNLVREPAARSRATERAREILQRSRELTASHGVGPVHLAIGHATWVEGSTRVSSPAMLRPVVIDEDGDGEILLTLRPGALIAPGLAAALARNRVVIDVGALLADARTIHGFAASRVIDVLRQVGVTLDRFELRDELVLGIFEHPAAILLREYSRPETLLSSDIVRALAGDGDARSRTAVELPPPNPADRDPWDESGAGDLTPRELDLVEAVSAGHNVMIDVPHGADGSAVLASMLVDAGSKGRSVLHIGGSPARTARLEGRLRALGVDEMVIRLDGGSASGDVLRARLGAAMSDTAGTVDPVEVREMRTKLREVRGVLSAYTTSLHLPFRQFGVSAFDALQVLTDLTSTHPSPRTRVRLHDETLIQIARDQGERARTLLHRAAALGIFSPTGRHEAWNGAVINSPEQVADILVRIMRLANVSLPQMRVHMGAVSGETGIKPATTMAQWEAQLAMLDGVRDVLDVFRPEVFERSAADMVIATAPKQWRRDHGISMGRTQRNRLIKQARDLVLPGRHVEDLHHELLLVQEKREAWRRHCDADGWPTLPHRLDEINGLAAQVRQDLDKLAPMLSTSHSDLGHMNTTELGRLLDRMASDPDGARELPQRVAVLKDLKAAGLEALVADLRARSVADELLDAELDLAWWASILGLMLSDDPRLGGFDPTRLEETLAQGRRLDVEQVASLAPQAIHTLRRLRQQAIASRPEQHADLLAAMSARIPAAELYARHALTFHLVPLVLTVPTLVPSLVPEGHRVDLVVLDDIDTLSVAELVPIIARARQVVVLADLEASDEGGAAAQLAEVVPVTRLEVPPQRLNDRVARLLSRYASDGTGVPAPWSAATSPVSAVWTNGSGMPAPGAAAVESSTAEVDAVVELVFEHAIEHPESSLAVIALNERHAERIRVGVSRAVDSEPGLASFFDEGGAEPFVVTDPSGARGLSRERIIVSVGFAKTPHGRVLHDFGVLSTARGAGLLVDVLRAVRADLTVVSSVRPGEVDRSRLSSEGAQMLIDLLEVAEGTDGEESAGWPILEAAPDRLLVDLADRLYGMGLEVVPNVGIEGGIRIPLAIGHPEVPGRLLVAVLTDDDRYVGEPSLRVRDRVWPAVLEAQGWKVRTELSMAVFIDPEKEAQDIVQLVLDAVDEINGPAPVAVEIPREAAFEVPEADPVFDAAMAEADSARERLDTLTSMVAVAIKQDADGGGAPASTSPVSAAESAVPAGHDDDGSESTPHAAPQAPAAINVAPGVARGPRPPIARGLPLAAYGDDQLDELAEWVRSDGIERTDAQVVEELRDALGLWRRGAQSDAVLGNVVRRTAPQS